MAYDPNDPEDINEHVGQYDGEIIQKEKKVVDGRVWEIVDATSGGGGSADNWGTQKVEHDLSLSGNGTTSSPLIASLDTDANNLLRRKSGGSQNGKLSVKLRTIQKVVSVTGSNTLADIVGTLTTDSISSMTLSLRGMLLDQAAPPMFTVATVGGNTRITLNPYNIPDQPTVEVGDRVVAIYTEPYN